MSKNSKSPSKKASPPRSTHPLREQPTIFEINQGNACMFFSDTDRTAEDLTIEDDEGTLFIMFEEDSVNYSNRIFTVKSNASGSRVFQFFNFDGSTSNQTNLTGYNNREVIEIKLPVDLGPLFRQLISGTLSYKQLISCRVRNIIRIKRETSLSKIPTEPKLNQN